MIYSPACHFKPDKGDEYLESIENESKFNPEGTASSLKTLINFNG